jgi:hypothetical protein
MDGKAQITLKRYQQHTYFKLFINLFEKIKVDFYYLCLD